MKITYINDERGIHGTILNDGYKYVYKIENNEILCDYSQNKNYPKITDDLVDLFMLHLNNVFMFMG